jgi:plasmid maintenance system antidote protein VapI
VDFGAQQLRHWAGEQAGEVMRVADFRAWMDEHGLTQEAAAQALGLSSRMVAYYLSGEKVIPKTVMLATEGWAKRVEA